MENQNVNSTTNVEELKRMFSDYQNRQNQPNKSTRRVSREDLLAKYFVPRKTREIFRILPPKPGKKHIEEAFFHVVTTNASGGKKKHGTVVYCPAHNDPKVQKMNNGQPVFDQNGKPVMVPTYCPLCAKYKKELSKQDQSLKGVKKENMTDVQKRIDEKNKEIYKEAGKWEAKKFYIVRGIDKGAEKDGVKFWRFKHNFKNQGTLDKLLPILQDYVDLNQVDFADPANGTDLSIMMADSEFNGHVYKAISAISARGKSPLHTDSLVMRQWLDDNITWRDVFLPKKVGTAISPEMYLQLIAEGNSPYWDDTDSNNKHWVVPGHPELQELANTRTRNLDADEDENFEQASDLDSEEYPRTTINNITERSVGTYKDDAVDIEHEVRNEVKNNPVVVENVDDTPDDAMDIDDLPF